MSMHARVVLTFFAIPLLASIQGCAAHCCRGALPSNLPDAGKASVGTAQGAACGSGGYLEEGPTESLPTNHPKPPSRLEKLAAAEAERDRLQAENDRLAKEQEALQAELRQMQAELAGALVRLAQTEDLVDQMREEYQKWNEEILAIQLSMRETQSAQLDALAKILQHLISQAESGAAQLLGGGNRP